MVLNVETKWGPSMHRFEQKFHHDLVSVIWRWKTRKKERPKRADYAAMDIQLWQSFDDQLRIKLQKKMETCVDNKGIDMVNNGEVTDVWVQRRYTELTECVQATIEEVVSNKKKISRNSRTISEESKALFEKRKREFSKRKPTAKERKKWNKKIKNACRQDYSLQRLGGKVGRCDRKSR